MSSFSIKASYFIYPVVNLWCIGIGANERYLNYMRLVGLTLLTMMAFASNSILTRMAVGGGHIDPSGFALIRVLAGAVMLGVLVMFRSGTLPDFTKTQLPGAISLTVYMIGFSLAYQTLDAGLGALILFGVVQIVMFAYAAIMGTAPLARQIIGASVAFGGLLLVLWPDGSTNGDALATMLMVLAGIGWAIYSIIGRSAADPLSATASSFILCFPLLALLSLTAGFYISPIGIALGVLCGALTSGLGYALWYNVLPHLDTATAATVQLSVPILAIFAGALFLGEGLSLKLILSATMVIGGVGWAVRRSAP